ncbi:hypothetical protein D915_010338 [Fasciola hepatica]|uniref:Uncharacterized protein n=1 Tax=Fasciola hepatica TaxID=6192 RepID=A0A4E0R051_FASHE|nr:hypothetical protein D915_010338 [Fasciola hepatica]
MDNAHGQLELRTTAQGTTDITKDSWEAQFLCDTHERMNFKTVPNVRSCASPNLISKNNNVHRRNYRERSSDGDYCGEKEPEPILDSSINNTSPTFMFRKRDSNSPSTTTSSRRFKQFDFELDQESGTNDTHCSPVNESSRAHIETTALSIDTAYVSYNTFNIDEQSQAKFARCLRQSGEEFVCFKNEYKRMLSGIMGQINQLNDLDETNRINKIFLIRKELAKFNTGLSKSFAHLYELQDSLYKEAEQLTTEANTDPQNVQALLRNADYCERYKLRMLSHLDRLYRLLDGSTINNEWDLWKTKMLDYEKSVDGVFVREWQKFRSKLASFYNFL